MGIEEGGGGTGGTIATSLGPVLGPADIRVADGGLDGQCGKLLEEVLTCRGHGVVRCWCEWRQHKKTHVMYL